MIRTWIHICCFLLCLFTTNAQEITDVRNYTAEDGLNSDHILEITQNRQGYIMLRTAKGWTRFNGYEFSSADNGYKPETLKLPTIDSIQLSKVEEVFLNKKEITTFFEDQDQSKWYGTKEHGLFYIPNTASNAVQRPEVHFEFVGFNNQKIDNPGTEISITPNFTTLSIGYVSLQYPAHGRINYQYKIDEIHEEWIDTKEKKIQFTALPDGGAYTFWVKARDTNGNWSEPVSLSLNFITPWYKTWTFRTGVIVAFLLLFWALIRAFFKRRLRIQRMQSELKDLEAKALQSQMNPHFVFNSLNSIQSFIATGDTMKSEIYLSKFSKLLRKTLDNSRTNTVSLSKEIEIINTYLELEKMRFEDRLSYNIEVQESIEQDLIEIPPMIIQPFIENAIVHGIGPKKEGGEVRLIITQENDTFIRCIIEDNGVGRDHSKNSEHSSLGTKIVTKRLTLLNTVGRGKINYVDLKDDMGKAKGTKVELIIPV